MLPSSARGCRCGREITRCALLWLSVAVGAPALGLCRAAWANDVSNSHPSTIAAPSQSLSQSSLPDLLRQMTDAGGLRSRLEEEGIRFTFTYYGDLFGNPSGGEQQGPGYDGRFGAIIDADLEKLAGWSGAKFHASFHQRRGRTTSSVWASPGAASHRGQPRTIATSPC